MKSLRAIISKELQQYFMTPIAYVFMAVFIFASAAFTFYLGGLLERGVADLFLMLQWFPWLFVVLVPAVTMRLWSEELRSGTAEMLFAMPISITELVVGKFLAAWIFVTIVIILSLSILLSLTFLGNPDLGVAFSGVLGAILVAGVYLALGCWVSSLTHNQVVAFAIATSASFGVTLVGHSSVLSALSGLAPDVLIEFLSKISLLVHYNDMGRGAFNGATLVYFLSLIMFFLFLNKKRLMSHRSS